MKDMGETSKALLFAQYCEAVDRCDDICSLLQKAKYSQVPNERQKLLDLAKRGITILQDMEGFTQ